MGPMLLMLAVGGMFAYAVVDIFDGSDASDDGGSLPSTDQPDDGDMLDQDGDDTPTDDDGSEDPLNDVDDGGDEDTSDDDVDDPDTDNNDDSGGDDDTDNEDDTDTGDDTDSDDASDDEGDNDDVELGVLPAVPFAITENDIGGRDIEVTLDAELAQQLVDSNGRFGEPIGTGSLGFLQSNGEAFLGQFGVDDLTFQDRINITTPDDFPYDITAFYSSFTVDGPGFQGDRLLLSITPEGFYDTPISSTEPVIQGGPLFETEAVDFGPEFVGINDQAEIDALVQSVSDDIGVAVEDIAFGSFEYEIYTVEDFGQRVLQTNGEPFSFFIDEQGDLLQDDPSATITEIFPVDVENARVYVLEGVNDDRTAVIAVAVLPDPEVFVRTVFNVNGEVLDAYNRLFYVS